MIVDFDTKQIKELKHGDLLICNGTGFTKISQTDLLKPLTYEINQLKNQIKNQNEVIRKANIALKNKQERFIRVFGGSASNGGGKKV